MIIGKDCPEIKERVIPVAKVLVASSARKSKAHTMATLPGVDCVL
jgi:hypothetical protein